MNRLVIFWSSILYSFALQAASALPVVESDEIMEDHVSQERELKEKKHEQYEQKQEQQEEKTVDPLGEFGNRPYFDNGNGETTNKNKWPEP